MDILGKLFSSTPLVKIMRLFMLNPETPFENKDIILRSKVSASALRTEISLLSGIKFIKKRSFSKEIAPKTKKGKVNPKSRIARVKKKKVSGWVLNPEFPHLYALRLLLLSADSVKSKKEIIKKLRGTGTIKLVVLSGIFLREEGSRIDMLVVGDRLSKANIERALKHIESEVGKELRYAAMDTKEFQYRLGMYDKFVRDILDYPHETILDKIGI